MENSYYILNQINADFIQSDPKLFKGSFTEKENTWVRKCRIFWVNYPFNAFHYLKCMLI